MKRWNLILLLLILAAGLAIGAGVSMLHNGLSARATPTAMEARCLAYPLVTGSSLRPTVLMSGLMNRS
jgi:hypothetical protein